MAAKFPLNPRVQVLDKYIFMKVSRVVTCAGARATLWLVPCELREICGEHLFY